MEGDKGDNDQSDDIKSNDGHGNMSRFYWQART